MERLQAFQYRIAPTGAQVRQMARLAGACLYAYNRALAQQQARHAAGEKKLGYFGVCKELTGWRHDPTTLWLADAPTGPLQQTLRDQERAYTNFFAGRAKHPTFKKKGRSRASFRYPNPKQIKLDQGNSRIFLPKLGWLPYINSRLVLGDVRSVTVSERAGHWYVSILTKREVPVPVHPSTSAVGIDRGVARFVTFSDGTFAAPLNSFKRHEARLARAQRALARKTKGSANYGKARRAIARLHAHIADARNDYLHKLSHTTSKTHAVVCLEDLRVVNMTASAKGTIAAPGRRVRQKAGLNKAILDQGWGEFQRQLEYKCAWRGGQVLLVPAANTSRRCPTSDGGCGHIDPANRKSQAVFACVRCGYTNNADVVGALNVVEAAGYAASACGGSALSGTPMKQEPTEATHARLSA